MSLATLVTNITSTARNITKTVRETQKVINTASTYTAKALKTIDTYFDTDTTTARKNIKTYTTTANNIFDTTLNVSEPIGSYQNLNLVYVTDTYTESVTVLQHHGLEDVSRILKGQGGWSWEKRADNLKTYMSENQLSKEEKDAVLHTLDQNEYLKKKHSDLYDTMTLDVILS